MDAICSIDLDTIIPGLWNSKLKRIPRVYDAHELFTELKEVISRPVIHRTWRTIEKYAVPQFKLGYTVSNGIAAEFAKRYNVQYATIRNVPVLKEIKNNKSEDFILYQGWVNEARGLEYLIPAMKNIDCKLVICGDGNFMEQLKELIKKNQVGDKIELKGMLSPEELWSWTCRAKIGVAFPESQGLNQYLALPNKFFDYMHAGVPQVTVNYPEYKQVNSQFDVALLVENTQPETITEAVNRLLYDHVLHEKLKQNCLLAREVFQWKNEETKLLKFWKGIL